MKRNHSLLASQFLGVTTMLAFAGLVFAIENNTCDTGPVPNDGHVEDSRGGTLASGLVTNVFAGEIVSLKAAGASDRDRCCYNGNESTQTDRVVYDWRCDGAFSYPLTNPLGPATSQAETFTFIASKSSPIILKIQDSGNNGPGTQDYPSKKTVWQGQMNVIYAYLTIFVKQPVPGTRETWTISTQHETKKGGKTGKVTVDVGHTWWMFSSTDDEALGRRGMNLFGARWLSCQVGFVPKNWNPNPLINKIHGPGDVEQGEEKNYTANVTKTFAISREGLISGLKMTDELFEHSPDYDLNVKNCTVVAVMVAQAAGIELPRTYGTWPNGMGLNPGDLGEDLRAMQP